MNYVIPANIETPYGELQKTKFWMIQGSPTTLVEGLPWYDSTAHLPKFYDGTSVKEFGRIYSNGTGISIVNNEISVTDPVLINKTSVSTSLTLVGTATSAISAVNIGYNSSTSGYSSVALGASASVLNDYGTAIGAGANASANAAIQIGYGTNSTAKSLSVGFVNSSDSMIITSTNWSLLDGTTGLIPDARLSSNIARTSAIPTSASDVGALPDTTKYGASLSMSLNTTTYVLTVGLKDQDGNTLGTDQTVDFPVESLVMDVEWNSTTKAIDITLKNGTTTSIPATDITNGLQPTIDSSHKLSADLVDDTNKTHKFATAAQLTQIATNKSDIEHIDDVISGYGNIVTHNASEFATSSQGTKADSAVQKYAVNNTAMTESGGHASIEITHGLGTDDVSVTVIKNSDHKVLFPVWDSNNGVVTIDFLTSTNIAANTYRIIIMG